MIALHIIEFCASFIEIILGILVNGTTLSNKKVKTKQLATVSFCGTVLIWISNQYSLFSTFTIILGLFVIAGGSCFLYKVNVMDSLVLTGAFLVVLFIADFFSISVFGLVLQNEEFARTVTTMLSLERIGFIILSKMILTIISVCYMVKWIPKVSIPVRKLLVGIALCVLILYFCIKNTFNSIDKDTFWSWTFFLLFVILSIYAFTQYVNYILVKHQVAVEMEQYRDQLKSYDRLIHNYQMNKEFFHDLKNQYIIIENYLQNHEYEKARVYMEELSHGLVMEEYICKTGIQDIDILLNYKIKEAKAKDIHVYFNVGVINVQLTKQEIAALLGNAFDNAIEACEQVSDDNKWVRINIYKQREMSVFKIENSCLQMSDSELKHLISHKPNPQTHGLGIRSMQRIVEKYNGKIKFGYSDNAFSVVILFFD